VKMYTYIWSGMYREERDIDLEVVYSRAEMNEGINDRALLISTLHLHLCLAVCSVLIIVKKSSLGF